MPTARNVVVGFIHMLQRGTHWGNSRMARTLLAVDFLTIGALELWATSF